MEPLENIPAIETREENILYDLVRSVARFSPEKDGLYSEAVISTKIEAPLGELGLFIYATTCGYKYDLSSLNIDATIYANPEQLVSKEFISKAIHQYGGLLENSLVFPPQSDPENCLKEFEIKVKSEASQSEQSSGASR